MLSIFAFAFSPRYCRIFVRVFFLQNPFIIGTRNGNVTVVWRTNLGLQSTRNITQLELSLSNIVGYSFVSSS